MSAAGTTLAAFALALSAFAGTRQDGGDDAARLGGPATVFDAGPNAFGHPSSTLTVLERRAFAVGNAFFKDNWIAAPASAAGRDGLGPLFNARSCSACHLRDGRGRPARDGEFEPRGLLLRVGLPGRDGEHGDAPHPAYGDQIQDRALPGVAPEARVRIRFEAIAGAYGDGEPFELERPTYALDEPGYGAPPVDLRVGARVAPQMIGLGLLEAIPVEDVLARADPDDADGDGISGRAHHVTSRRTGALALGRFGWKATQPTVEEQVAAAFANDIGITSTLFPDECLAPEQLGVEFASGGAPELDDHKLERVAFYSAVLAVPAQRAHAAPAVRRGGELFASAGCAACHVPAARTGSVAVAPSLANAAFRPYTDLLLHDLGPELADGKRDGDAGEAEWRTPPLWGIGLFETVNGHTRYLHDGRARDLAEAILWHGGEAAGARERFRTMPRDDRAALLAFLRSL